MFTFPLHIEQYLAKSGLSSTEILILRHLVETEMLTLRQLAAKTGKSTGVLHQAAKHLLQKGIISRQSLNAAPHYLLRSLDSICVWVREDVHRKETMLLRRQQDLSSFLSSFTQQKTWPEMTHFEGQEGIIGAYTQLLTLKTKELMSFLPITTREEEHPLHDFHRQFLHERRSRGIFLCVLANDTSLGRRYKSRDPFEYRLTTLIPEKRLTISFERIIAGDTIACFDLAEQRACLLRYPQLAQAERALFLSLAGFCEATASVPSLSSATLGQRVSTFVRNSICPPAHHPTPQPSAEVM